MTEQQGQKSRAMLASVPIVRLYAAMEKHGPLTPAQIRHFTGIRTQWVSAYMGHHIETKRVSPINVKGQRCYQIAPAGRELLAQLRDALNGGQESEQSA